MKILVSLTTMRDDWGEKIDELSYRKINEIALFPTGIDAKKRNELYKLLEKSSIKNISHVHLRNDMDTSEIDYFSERFNTKLFNIHSKKAKYPFMIDFKQYYKNIFVENVDVVPSDDELEEFGGLCLDYSHWEDAIKKNYTAYVEEIKERVRKYKIGCCHISAMKDYAQEVNDDKYASEKWFSWHEYDELREFDYLKNYKHLFPEIVSLELNNTIEEQLKAIKYIEKIIKS